MPQPTWIDAFPGWEHGAYRGYSGVYRRRTDGLNIRVLAGPADGAWLLSFWRARDSETYQVSGPTAEMLARVLAIESVTVGALLIDLHQRTGMEARTADLPGFEWTGRLEGGGIPPTRVPPEWTERFTAAGWAVENLDGVAMVTRQLGSRRIRLTIDPLGETADFTPQAWLAEFTRTAHGLKRLLGDVPAGPPVEELYVVPWSDTEVVLDRFLEMSEPEVIADERDWFRRSTDAAVALAAPGQA